MAVGPAEELEPGAPGERRGAAAVEERPEAEPGPVRPGQAGRRVRGPVRRVPVGAAAAALRAMPGGGKAPVRERADRAGAEQIGAANAHGPETDAPVVLVPHRVETSGTGGAATGNVPTVPDPIARDPTGGDPRLIGAEVPTASREAARRPGAAPRGAGADPRAAGSAPRRTPTIGIRPGAASSTRSRSSGGPTPRPRLRPAPISGRFADRWPSPSRSGPGPEVRHAPLRPGGGSASTRVRSSSLASPAGMRLGPRISSPGRPRRTRPVGSATP